MVWGECGEQRLQGRDEVQCHLKTQRRQKIGIHDAFAFSFRAFFSCQKCITWYKKNVNGTSKGFELFLHEVIV